MPYQHSIYLIYPENKPPIEGMEFKTHEEAEVEAKRLEVETGVEHFVYDDARYVLTPEEQASLITVYMLSGESCNGEYCSTFHRTLHTSLEDAKAMHAKMLNQELLKGEGAINEWRDKEYSGEPGVLEFRTGNWGYVVFEIRPLKLIQCVTVL
jgi:hypothetical protein